VARHRNESESTSVSTRRLYASAIAIVSGLYSVLLGFGAAGTWMDATIATWLMAAVGVVAVVHGVVLLTPVALRLGSTSGPLMIGYALVMILFQTLSAVGMGMGGRMGGMNGGMGGGMSAGMASGITSGMGTGWNAGMVALALLMLVSGLIMFVRRDRMTSGEE
jgi:hypothetical protein